MRSINTQQGGFSLVAVVFLILIVSSGAALIANISTASLTQSQRAYTGSQLLALSISGLEYGVSELIDEDRCDDEVSIDWPVEDGLSGYNTLVTCELSSVSYLKGEPQSCNLNNENCYAHIISVSSKTLSGTTFIKTREIEVLVSLLDEEPGNNCPGNSQRPDGTCPGNSGGNGNGSGNGNSGNSNGNGNSGGGNGGNGNCPGNSQRPDGSCPGNSGGNGNGSDNGNSGNGNSGGGNNNRPPQCLINFWWIHLFCRF